MFARRFAVPNVHASIEALASDPEVDVVFIASPNHLHAPQALAALRHRRAVVCEKPFACSAAEAREVAAAARAAKRFCMEALWTRFVPATVAVLDLVAAGAIGEPRLLAASLGVRITAEDSPSRHDPRCGGGALLDLGVYPLALSAWILGTPAGVTGRAEISPAGVDIAGEALLTHARGATAFVAFTLERALANDAWILGSEGRIRLEAPLHRSEAFTLERFDDVRSRARATGGLERLLDTQLGQRAHAAYRGLTARTQHGKRVRVPARGNGYCHQIEEAMQCLRSQRTEHPLLPLEGSIALLETTDRLRACFAAGNAPRGPS